MNDDFKKILVAVDDSDDAILAFKYAIERAKKDNASLTIVSVLEDEDMNIYQALTKDYIHGERSELEQHVLDYQKQAQAAGVKDVNVIVSEGVAGETIVKDVIPHVDPDLLIIGSESKKGIAKHFGSQAAYMAKYAPISVMVIR
ncbi:universal stress protein [Apilactobacillus xinyiensis]|uniref:Universal stress protein n=1 Tax=Apilactobacillus xinyiensis TaxID=2841032 RepID=A0ABT0I1H0_9LACO|nr:universal stress protein [Apilactobacillus xinyiensis]MCK8624572.1 universal stress protein [Apilactobacillus xinyiensis]MCL0312464.1 universal stress protein [Apilactobacillus xinyiensis]MCL0318565.1 universal stress protein [Apilactobacillus xinyiensis]